MGNRTIKVKFGDFNNLKVIAELKENEVKPNNLESASVTKLVDEVIDDDSIKNVFGFEYRECHIFIVKSYDVK